MQAVENTSFADLVEQYLDARLPQHLAESIDMPGLPTDTRAFIVRMLALMQRAGYPITGFSPVFIRWLSTTIPGILPSAWGGRIPPLTLPDRHRKFDLYVAKQNWAAGNGARAFLDVGCGFPPVTTADTARKFPDWQVCGIDRSFAAYVLYNQDGHYACFDETGGFQYFQGLTTASGRALYADPKATRKRFSKVFKALFPLLPDSSETTSNTIEKDGHRLIHHHIRDFEVNNLAFVDSDITELEFEAVKVIRCMNMLIYFEPDIRKKMLRQMGRFLDKDGILITGTNGMGIQSRYVVYQKGPQGLVPGEFAFSLDNLGPISFMAWFTLHADDPEAALLAELTGIIRSDHHFWTDFAKRIDELLRHYEVCERDPDGFFRFYREEMPPAEYLEINARLWKQMQTEGYVAGALAILKQAGYKAWENPIGDIAVRPAVKQFL